MTFPIPPGSDDPDVIPRAVVSLTIEGDLVGETEPHQHQKAQLIYVINGVVTVEAASGIWTVPPQCAVWIPAGVIHLARSTGHITIGSLYIEPGLAGSFLEECGIVFVPPLLRELLMRFISGPQLYPEGETREARLVSVLLDELQAAPVEPLHLPMPRDRRLRRLAETLIETPSLRFTTEEWGARVGASKRTLSRLFQRETGMSFIRWKQQLHVGLALQRLALGEAVTNIAIDLGYESPSGFIAMFRRMVGQTPVRYFSEAVSNSSADTAPRKVIHIGATELPSARTGRPEDRKMIHLADLRRGKPNQ